MMTWILAIIVLVVAVALTVSHIKEQARFASERQYNEDLRRKKVQGELVSEAAFDEKGNRVELEELDIEEAEGDGTGK